MDQCLGSISSIMAFLFLPITHITYSDNDASTPLLLFPQDFDWIQT